MSSEIKGLEEVLKKLYELPTKLEKKVLRSAVRKGAVMIRDKARGYAPTDTGNLKKSIVVMNKRIDGKIALKVGVLKRKSKNSKDPFYARFVEFGTSKMVAKPFMRPAFDASSDDVLEVVVNDIKLKVEEATQ